MQFLPHGQVEAATSPRSPGYEEHLAPTLGAEAPFPPVQVGQDEVGCHRAIQRATTGLRAKTPQSMCRVVDERHLESLGEHPHIDRRFPAPWQGDAAIIFTGSLRLDGPSSPPLKFSGIKVERFENHAVNLLL
jgi:hypothetical protein